MLYSHKAVKVVILCFLTGVFIISCQGKGGNPLIPGNEPGSSLTLNSFLTDPVVEDNNWNQSVNFGNPPGRSDLEYAPGEVLVHLDETAIPAGPDGKPVSGTHQVVTNLLSQHGLSIKEVIRTSWGNLYRLGITDGSSVDAKVAELNSLDRVDFAEPNYTVTLDDVPYLPNDPLYENASDGDLDPRTNVFEQWGHIMTGTANVWNETVGQSSVVVCVLDSGVIWDHEDLYDNMWVNEDEIPDNGEDDDENGYIDDIYGWDAADDDPDIKEYNNNHHYHGTACSGCVAAIQDNSLGCSGVAPGVRIMGVKISFDSWNIFVSSVVEGVQYAVDNDADIITMSFGTDSYTEAMDNAIQSAWDAGLILCGSAGNEDTNKVRYPSSFPGVVRVGASCSFGPRWSYVKRDEVRISKSNGFWWGSTFGHGLEIMAYGDNWITTSGLGTDRYWDGEDDFFFRGTSNACPMAAGAFAILWSMNPGATNQWLRDRMKYTADDLNIPGYDEETGYGRYNLLRAVYGSDRYESEEDLGGFVSLNPHDGQVFDSLSDVSEGPYADTEDLYKYTVDSDGVLQVDLDIFTWGENLNLELYSSAYLVPGNLVDAAYGENHANTSHEGVVTQCHAGETYYIRVIPGGPGDSTSYGLSTQIVEPVFNLETYSNDPGFVHIGRTGMLAGTLEFSVNHKVHVSQLITSVLGTVPMEKITGIHLYRDSNRNFSFDDNDALVADGNFNQTNRAIFYGLNEELVFVESPQQFYITVDLENIAENAQFELVLNSYKDVTTSEGVELPYAIFPKYIGSFDVGVDIDPPTWDTTTGIQLTEARYESAIIRWNQASDPLTPPVKYNVYWTQELPFDFGTADVQNDVNKSDGGDYDYKWQIPDLINSQSYYVAVRAEDQAGNEDANTVYLEVIPTDESLPYAPQVIGSLDTPGNAWEVKSDPANQRVFVADYNSGVLTVDVSDPTDPQIVSQYESSLVSGVDYDGTNVYGAGYSGLLILNPDGSSGLESVAGVEFEWALDVCVENDYAYLTNHSTGLLPVDVSDPAHPQKYPQVESGNVGYGLAALNNYLYVSANSKPRVFDLSDPAAPAFVKEFGGSGAYEVKAVADRLYVTYWSDKRFSIYDLADPGDPQWLGGWTSNSGSGASDTALYNGYLYFGTNNHYIEVMDITDPADILEVGQVSTNGPDGMDTDGIYIYSAENEHGLKIII